MIGCPSPEEGSRKEEDEQKWSFWAFSSAYRNCSPLCQSVGSSKESQSRRGASPPSSASPPEASCAPWLFRCPSPVKTQSHFATGAWNTEKLVSEQKKKKKNPSHTHSGFEFMPQNISNWNPATALTWILSGPASPSAWLSSWWRVTWWRPPPWSLRWCSWTPTHRSTRLGRGTPPCWCCCASPPPSPYMWSIDGSMGTALVRAVTITHGWFQSAGDSLMQLATIKRFGLESDDCRVAWLGAGDVDFAAQFYPGDREDGAGICARQRERVLLIVLQHVQTSCRWRRVDHPMVDGISRTHL